jgi:hypothetical protein
MTPGNLAAFIGREEQLRSLALAFSRLPARVRRRCGAPPTGCGLHDTFVYAEADDRSQSAEGVIVGGQRDEAGSWEFAVPFTIFTTDYELLTCQGYNCHVEIQ